jgi:D-amino peptidase
MTRVLIIADMEGVIGIERKEACDPRLPEYEAGAQLLAAEINVVGAAARQAGATSVSVIDWHAGGGNLKQEMLDVGVEIVPEDFAPGYDVVLLTGFHAMAGTTDAFISHTMSQRVTLEMNGEQAGELALLSRWAGDEGVPVAIATGDRAATVESKRFLPGTPTLTVKDTLSWERAQALPPEQAYEQIHRAVVRAVSDRDGWRIYQSRTPVHFRIKLNPESATATKIPWLSRDADGWLVGQVDSTKDVIDLIDVLTALA